MRNVVVLLKFKEERNILRTGKRSKINLIGYICVGTAFSKRFCRKLRLKDRSDAKTRKKRYAATG